MADKADRTQAPRSGQSAERAARGGPGGGGVALLAPGSAGAATHNAPALQQMLDQARQGPACAPPPALRQQLEAATGGSLADVRLHTGAASQQAARALEAKAFTVGRDVHFGAGQFNPGRPDGDHLIAHELVHTLQQGPNSHAPQAKLDVSRPGEACEREADSIANAVLSRRVAGTGRLAVTPAPVRAARAAVTRVDIKNGDSTFKFDPYIESDADNGRDTARKVGVKIELTHVSAPSLRSDKIAFVQTMKPTKGGASYLFDNMKPRGTAASDGDEGWAVDRLAGKNSPNYGQDNDGAAASNTRFGSRTDAAATNAWMYDNIQLNRAVGQTVAVDAVTYALDETHGVYLGGVSWGFATDAAGKTTKTVPALADAGSPTGVKLASLKKWNEQADLADTGKRNAVDQKKVAIP